MSVTASPKNQPDFQPRVSVSKNDDVLINLNEKVGKWTYGDYFKGVSKKLGKELMVKMVDLTKFPLKKSCLETELAILQQLKTNPYIVRFMEYKYYKKSLVITTESYNGGDLKSYLKKHGRIPEEEAIRLLMQLICGLKALHQLKYIHGAVRPENILLHEEDGKLTLKLSNFIFARQYDGDMSAKFPMPFDSLYLAPEVLRDEVYHPSSDVWSVGVIFYEMLYGTFPWTGRTKEELRDNIINKNLDLSVGDGISDTSIEFLYKCLHRDISKRLDWKTITEHRLLFRALFMNDDGTYKLYNDEFKEFSPSKRNLMYGIKVAGGSLPGTPKSNKGESSFKRSTTKPFLSASKTIEFNNGNGSYASTPSHAKSPFILKTDQSPKSTKSRSPSPKNFKLDENALEVSRDRESTLNLKLETVTPHNDDSAAAFVAKKSDPDFYPRLVSKLGDSNDYYLAKFLNKESLDNKGPFSKKNFVKPFKWLANKAEILGEIYELAVKNRQHCCYDKIIQLVNEENSSWNTIDLASVMQKQFMETVESFANKDEEKNMMWPKEIKANISLAKKEKSQKIAALIEEIVVSLTNSTENSKANNEELLQVAADLKILREFDEIGDNIMKELNVMKNALIVFYRKKDHTHVRYLLLVRNLA